MEAPFPLNIWLFSGVYLDCFLNKNNEAWDKEMQILTYKSKYFISSHVEYSIPCSLGEQFVFHR